MSSQSETYRQKAESLERVAKRLMNRKDPIGRKVFASAERSARRFRNLAKILEVTERSARRFRNHAKILELMEQHGGAAIRSLFSFNRGKSSDAAVMPETGASAPSARHAAPPTNPEMSSHWANPERRRDVLAAARRSPFEVSRDRSDHIE